VGLTTTQIALWLSAFVLELTLCVLAFRQRWHKRLPFFSAYLVALAADEVFTFLVYRTAGFTSKTALYSYWIGDAILLAGRGLSVGELAWVASRPYAGFRRITKWVLTITACLLLVRAGIASTAHLPRLPQFVLTLDADIEITAAIVLVLLFALVSWYEVYLPISEKLIAAGLLTYSIIQVVNNSISSPWLQSVFYGWSIVRTASFQVALILWIFALAMRPQTQANHPEPLTTEEARDFMAKGTAILQELANQLSRFRRKL
jgi:hypothetical protein